MAAKKLGKKPVEVKLQGRPPIVAVLGHVDHGKTSLISKIYNLDLTKKESGSISQHTGAYQINFQGKKITFIDTPGHAAFSKMRSRGSQVADLVVLVVAANEGVMPQTLESLKHIQKAKIPFLVAINKIDLPEVNLDWLKKNLAENGIMVEGYGGDIVTVPVSAVSGKGIDQLLEMIILLGEMAELKANPKAQLEAVIIESKLDSRRGPVASILIRNGSLKINDEITAAASCAKIKAMFDNRGQKVTHAIPGQAVEVLGFTQVPAVGAAVEKKSISGETKVEVKKEPKQSFTAEEEGERLKIILKADVTGTLEAITASLPAEILLIFSGVGDISQSDVLLARTTGAEIIGFRVKAAGAVKKLAETEGIKVKTYQIIYELLEELEKRVLKILEPTIDENVFGEAQIVKEFEIKNQRIAGCKVIKGKILKQEKVHLKRGKIIIGSGQIRSMKTAKTDIEKASLGEEFGAVLSESLDFKVGDMLISFK